MRCLTKHVVTLYLMVIMMMMLIMQNGLVLQITLLPQNRTCFPLFQIEGKEHIQFVGMCVFYVLCGFFTFYLPVVKVVVKAHC